MKTETLADRGDRNAFVTVRRVAKKFHPGRGVSIEALRGVTFDAFRGEVVAIVGPSGSGKSTVLHALGGMEEMDAGSLRVDGVELVGAGRPAMTQHRRTSGFVFQRFHLLSALDALSNVLAPVVPYHVSFDKKARAMELLDRVGLRERAGAPPSQLSGGEQQRVAIARALINAPRLILADEPTGNLDSGNAQSVMDLLLEVATECRATLFIATHDAGIAGRAHSIIELRDGVVVGAQRDVAIRG